jgi:hypothetical protein
MKPKLIHNWPDVQKEHEDVSNIIKKTIRDFKYGPEPDNLNCHDNLKNTINRDGLEKDLNSYQRHMSRDEISYGEIYQDKRHFNSLMTEKY